jgi:hypothetical protein
MSFFILSLTIHIIVQIHRVFLAKKSIDCYKIAFFRVYYFNVLRIVSYIPVRRSIIFSYFSV